MDSPVTVTSVWKKDGVMVTSSASRILPDTTLLGNSRYLSQILFNPFQLSSDDGAYACEVNINAENAYFVIGTGLQSENITLRTSGMLICLWFSFVTVKPVYSDHLWAAKMWS